MFLQKEEIIKRSPSNSPESKGYPLIENFSTANVSSISYDLKVKEVFWTKDDKEMHGSKHTLHAGESVFVSSQEILHMPDDLVGFIVPRNSSIRMGLDIAAPVYRPGHKTRCFIRVTNIGLDDVTIRKDDSIFSIMFYQLAADVSDPYKGQYRDQLEYEDIKNVGSVQNAIAQKVAKSADEIKSITKNIYATVLTLMAIFVAIFSIFNTTFFRGKEAEAVNLYSIIFHNLVIIGSICALGAVVLVLIDQVKTKKMTALFAIFLICLAVSICMIPKVNL